MTQRQTAQNDVRRRDAIGGAARGDIRAASSPRLGVRVSAALEN
jgi:hypothetical protein